MFGRKSMIALAAFATVATAAFSHRRVRLGRFARGRRLRWWLPLRWWLQWLQWRLEPLRLLELQVLLLLWELWVLSLVLPDAVLLDVLGTLLFGADRPVRRESEGRCRRQQ